MVTPFDGNGALDVDGAVVLARWLADNGTDCLVLGGSTGEGAALEQSEAQELWRAVVGAVTVPVIASTGSSNTRHTIELTKAASDAGVDALLVVTPYYSRPSQAGIAAHFEAVSAVSPLPILLYDVPVRTGRKISTETALRLARDLPNIVGVKDAAGDVVSTARLVAQAPTGFEVYCGDDLFTLPMLSIGAVGIVSVAAHWVGPQLSEIVASFAKGDTSGAQALNARYLEQIAFQSSEEYPNPMPAKAICRALGLPAGQCRLPVGQAPAELDELAARLVASLPG
jgi:4-hydroxy-tetrahydrodipicolinate synthase